MGDYDDDHDYDIFTLLATLCQFILIFVLPFSIYSVHWVSWSVGVLEEDMGWVLEEANMEKLLLENHRPNMSHSQFLLSGPSCNGIIWPQSSQISRQQKQVHPTCS